MFRVFCYLCRFMHPFLCIKRNTLAITSTSTTVRHCNSFQFDHHNRSDPFTLFLSPLRLNSFINERHNIIVKHHRYSRAHHHHPITLAIQPIATSSPSQPSHRHLITLTIIPSPPHHHHGCSATRNKVPFASRPSPGRRLPT